ncbi:MAG: hypothetical protein FJZ16_03435, partial [Candidatus Omnitrophica bacterium]|nr:hypothetical protein [Candidatus Omnitrophota bacterium]
SLGGMAIGVGMLIDNAIVVVESIYRYRRQGLQAKEAAVIGSNEVIAPMIASTLTTICVFFPMVFVVGIAGQLFKELAWVVIVTQVVSLIIAFMLIPCLVSQSKDKSYIKKATKTEVQEDEEGLLESAPRNKFLEFLGKPIDLIEIIYAKVIEGFLKHRFLYLLMVFLMFLFSMRQFLGLDREFMPKIDQGQFVMKIDMSPGTRISVTDSVIKKIENLLLTDPVVSEITLNIGSSRERARGEMLETLGSHQAQIMVNLKKERQVSTADFMQGLKDKLSKMELLQAEIQFIAQESALKTAFESSAPVIIDIKGPNINTLRTLTEAIQLHLGKVNGLYGIKNNLASPSPETKIWVLKDSASTYGLSVKDIAATAQVALKGYIATRFKEAGKEIDIRVRLRQEDRKDISKVGAILLSSPLGMQVPLKEVTYIGIGKGPSEIRRIDQQRTVLISANIYKRPLNEVQEEINQLLGTIRIPKGYTVKLTGETERMKESFQSLIFALTLAVILVYMIMAAQFESLWQPFLIMFTIPLSLIGIVWTLYITHTTLSVVVLLGIIMQGGIVVNNGIILIDYTNILRSRSVGLYDAAVRAGKVRLRPILMTAFTSVLGLLPLALGFSEGSELDAPLAKTTMGGLLSATFLTLVVIPSLYLSSTKIAEAVFRRKKQIPLEAAVALEEKRVEEKAPIISTETSRPQTMLKEVGAMLEKPVEPPLIKEAKIEEVEIKKETSPVEEEPKTISEEPRIIEEEKPIEELPPELEKEKLTPEIIEEEKPAEKLPPELEREKVPSLPVEEEPKAIPEAPKIIEEKIEPVKEILPEIEQKTETPAAEEPKIIEEEKPAEELPPELEREKVPSPTIEEEPKVVPEEPRITEEEKPSEVILPELEPQKEELLPAPPEQKKLPELEPQIPQALPKEEKITEEEKPKEEILAREKYIPPLNKRQRKAIEYLRQYSAISRKDYAKIFKTSVPTAARDLKDLVERGLIIGRGPLAVGRYYELVAL